MIELSGEWDQPDADQCVHQGGAPGKRAEARGPYEARDPHHAAQSRRRSRLARLPLAAQKAAKAETSLPTLERQKAHMQRVVTTST